jgi:hypothetical protein
VQEVDLTQRERRVGQGVLRGGELRKGVDEYFLTPLRGFNGSWSPTLATDGHMHVAGSQGMR